MVSIFTYDTETWSLRKERHNIDIVETNRLRGICKVIKMNIELWCGE